ncbi:EF-hand calcium-binding domain-containing protein 10-like isoform X1 [Acipenser ruthenus]|uniref:EF-hand calcium-binding domain-containing protein 10-like isoform X1 n=1 Tax=Acipenser ruthenus TaxID=7906 RepID=UPI00145BA5BF|nr:EF-hand calcium-binding domain-containing protein 10-like isoform X1 [Acipenser ruthenus]
MATSRELEANNYLEKHKILEFMDNLTSMLFFHRPERPCEFLITQLERLKLARTTSRDYPCLFNESNLEAIFGILDPTRQGYITVGQYKEALNTIGLKQFVAFPQGADCNRITLETFKKETKDGLIKSSATFKS